MQSSSVPQIPVCSVAIAFLLDSEPYIKLLNVQAPMVGRMKRSDSVIVDVIVGTDLISMCSLSLDSHSFTLAFPE